MRCTSQPPSTEIRLKARCGNRAVLAPAPARAAAAWGRGCAAARRARRVAASACASRRAASAWPDALKCPSADRGGRRGWRSRGRRRAAAQPRSLRCEERSEAGARADSNRHQLVQASAGGAGAPAIQRRSSPPPPPAVRRDHQHHEAGRVARALRRAARAAAPRSCAGSSQADPAQARDAAPALARRAPGAQRAGGGRTGATGRARRSGAWRRRRARAARSARRDASAGAATRVPGGRSGARAAVAVGNQVRAEVVAGTHVGAAGQSQRVCLAKSLPGGAPARACRSGDPSRVRAARAAAAPCRSR